MSEDSPVVKKTKRVVREYMVRMRKNYETLHGTTTDNQIDCPYCGFSRAMRVHNVDKRDHVWICSWDTCRKQLPLEYSPPTQEELEMFWDRKRFLQKINGFFIAMECW